MVFRQRVPRPPLDLFIESIWVCRNEPQTHALERVLPTGASQLIVNLKEDRTRVYSSEPPYECITSSGTVLSGVRSRYCIIDTSEQEDVAGAVFRPGGTSAFVREPAIELADAHVPLEALWGRARSGALRDRLLESTSLDAKLDVFEEALRELCGPRSIHPAVAFALTAFDRAPCTTSVQAVTDRIGLSAKRFIERFKLDVGVTPKRYCRIRRFQRAVAQTHRCRDVNWTDVALDCGYFDQAHFIHDFRSFAGLTPTGYQASMTGFQNHVKFLQSDTSDI